MENLNRSNFWDHLYNRLGSVRIFCDWIDQYKTAESYTWRVVCRDQKFQDLPLIYQALILRKFMQETGLPEAKNFSRFLTASASLETVKSTVITFFEKLDENIKY